MMPRDLPDITLRPMTDGDIPLGMELKSAAGWNQLEADWRAFLSFRPGGCFVASWKGTPAGTVATIEYGRSFGWVAMLLVYPDYRRRGIGTALLNRAIQSLESCETIKLDATPAGKTVYDQRGFHDEYRFARMVCPRFAAPLPDLLEPDIRPLESVDLPRVIRFDGEIFGQPRGGVLQTWHARAPRYAFLRETSDGRRGVCLGRAGANFEHIGPVVATDLETAEALLRAALHQARGKPTLVDAFLHDDRWPSFLEALGFRKERELIRMFRGPNRFPGKPEMQWAASGPELG